MAPADRSSVADAVRVLAVLALNDHVLKEAWPGWVTGKLSDVAGLVFAPGPPTTYDVCPDGS